MSDEKRKGIIEALLFASNKLLEIDEIVELFKVQSKSITKDEVHACIQQLNNEYETTGRSFSIVEFGGKFRICTRPEFSVWIQELLQVKTVDTLTKPALETLAIVAYRQPITKMEVEAIRGVSVDGVLRKLIDLNLVDIAGKKDVLGRPFMYKTTDKFLDYFGLRSIEELPGRDELTVTLDKKVEKEKEDEHEHEGVPETD